MFKSNLNLYCTIFNELKPKLSIYKRNLFVELDHKILVKFTGEEL